MAEFSQHDVVGGLITILLATLLIYFAARLVLDSSSFLAALASAVLSTLLAGVVLVYVDGTLGWILAALVWSLMTAVFFRTRLLKGAIIGLVAWALAWLIRFIVDRF